MQHPGFFERAGPYTIKELAAKLNAETKPASDRVILDIKTLQDAGPDDISFLNNRKYLANLATTKAGA